MDRRNLMEAAGPFYRALEVIAKETAPTGAKWLIGGSAGLLLRGLALSDPPRDLDLYADDAAAAALHKALLPYAVDEQHESVSPIYRSVLSHYLIEGIQVELVGGFVVSAGEDRYAVEVEDVLAPLQTTITIGACKLGLVPLAHELWFNVLREREDRTRLIVAQMRQEPAIHMGAAGVIASGNQLTEKTKQYVQQLLRG
ncbi:hypothetical protein [Paenibacillus sp. CF384]|uniref:hypothetical protein n=1 Tax=Paenibacillus sp. CF384 TaxID=1884382 RepID=UPI000899D188|nr:hypothetical protein [Paenibacillus sp. CF384]SDW30933.1 hypothetical protein SAMN05518855_10011027 [Paenibacillus sp. CF384]